MHRSRPLGLSLPLLLALLGACDKGEQQAADTAPSEDSPSPELDAPAPSSPAPALTADPRLAEPLSLNPAVPANAVAVAVLRTPESLFDVATRLSWFGARDTAQDQALREELDAYSSERIGVKLSAASSLTIFMIPGQSGGMAPAVGLVFTGIEGELRGPEGARHGDTPLVDLGDDLLGVARDSTLVLGDEAALGHALDTLDGKTQALAAASEGLGPMLVKEGAGSRLAIAASFDSLPPDMSDPARELGVSSGYIGMSDTALHIVAFGDPAKLSAAALQIKAAMSLGLAELEKLSAEARTEQSVFAGMGSIASLHSARRIAELVEPKVEGDRMNLDLPLQVRDASAILAIGGVAAAVAIPAFIKYIRRAKTAEAKVQLAKIFDSASAYFQSEHVSRGATNFDPDAPQPPPHLCPNDGREKGESGITPPLSLNCNEGPGGRCIPVGSEPSGPAEYNITAWNDHPVWNALNYMQEQGHYFHYNFIWANDLSHGYGRCQFTIQAFADLDDDGVFSTFERAGAADEFGVNAAIGLYIDQETE